MSIETHEIRDPIHNFVRLGDDERNVVNSRPFQRLRHIHQLGMSHFVYPGANHTRFEHSLGVMALASRVFDTITGVEAQHPDVGDVVGEIQKDRKRWRATVRMAALCHDLGHLPFSHAAEEELLPDGYDHEHLTIEMIRGDDLSPIWPQMDPPLDGDQIARIAVGAHKYARHNGDTAKQPEALVEALLSEIITGDAVGVDRMDYLLRDAHHCGVAYGKFDHYRLIDTLRVLPEPLESDAKHKFALGVEEGGLHTVEALLLARYFMFTQVYFHHVRRAYDIHLKEFLKAWLPGGQFAVSIDELMQRTDNQVMAAMACAFSDPQSEGHVHARRILKREHFRKVYAAIPEDLEQEFHPGWRVYQALCDRYGKKNVAHDSVPPKPGQQQFPVVRDDKEILSSAAISDVIPQIPQPWIDLVFVREDLRKDAAKCIECI